MNIIGRTDDGARLISVSTQEISELTSALEALSFFVLGLSLKVSEAEAPRAIAAQPQPEKTTQTKTKERTARPSPAGEKRLCLICEKPLPKNHPTWKTHRGKCLTMFAREYARNHWREKHGVKNPSKSVDSGPAVNPADPFLNDQQRLKLRKNRMDILKTINERLDKESV